MGRDRRAGAAEKANEEERLLQLQRQGSGAHDRTLCTDDASLPALRCRRSRTACMGAVRQHSHPGAPSRHSTQTQQRVREQPSVHHRCFFHLLCAATDCGGHRQGCCSSQTAVRFTAHSGAATASVSSVHVSRSAHTQCECCCMVLTIGGALLHGRGAAE